MIPKDLELLQVFDRLNTLREFLNNITFDQIRYLRYMLDSLHTIILASTSELAGSKELPTGDDHFQDFASYCLSLPRDRIQALIPDPCHELTINKPHYITLTGNSTHENEGYLVYEIDDFIRETFNIDLREYIRYHDAITFISSY